MVNNFETIEFAIGAQARGTSQQTADNLLWRPPFYRYPTNSSLNDYSGGRIALGSVSIHNRAAATVSMAFGGRIANKHWVAGQWTNTAEVGTDDTTAAQDTTTNDFPLEIAATDNDGHYFACDVPFNMISYNMSTASVKGTTVARALRYSSGNAAWTALATNLFLQDGAADDHSTGEELIVFDVPSDWVTVSSSQTLFTTTPAGINGRYVLNIRSTDSPDTTAALAKSIELWRMFYVTEGLVDNGTFDAFFEHPFLFPKECDAFGVFISTSNVQNRVTAQIGMV